MKMKPRTVSTSTMPGETSLVRGQQAKTLLLQRFLLQKQLCVYFNIYFSFFCVTGLALTFVVKGDLCDAESCIPIGGRMVVKRNGNSGVEFITCDQYANNRCKNQPKGNQPHRVVPSKPPARPNIIPPGEFDSLPTPAPSAPLDFTTTAIKPSKKYDLDYAWISVNDARVRGFPALERTKSRVEAYCLDPNGVSSMLFFNKIIQFIFFNSDFIFSYESSLQSPWQRLLALLRNELLGVGCN